MEVEEIIQSYDIEIERTERIVRILSELPEGNNVEIGAGHGYTTKRLAVFSKKLLVIDPFYKIDGSVHPSYIDPYALDVFLYNMRMFTNYELHREASLHRSTKEKIFEFMPINFVFVDGLQFKEIVLKELQMLELFEPNIICVDDINRLTSISEVPLAVEEFLKYSKYKKVEMKTECQECYLIKK